MVPAKPHGIESPLSLGWELPAAIPLPLPLQGELPGSNEAEGVPALSWDA